MSSQIDALPKLSIGMPVYNGEQLLADALTSILSQTFSDFELIVCDNASSDRTAEICREFAAQDGRIRYVRNQHNLGAIPNFNRVASLARAPYFKWSANDDLIAPTFLAECIDILENDPTVVLAHSATAFIGEDGNDFAWDQSAQAYLDPLTGAHHRPDPINIGTSPYPVVRYRQVLNDALWGTHMFGIMRRDALLKTSLLQNFCSSDRMMLAELALLGRFAATPNRLFMKRLHSRVSWALNQQELKEFLSTTDKNYSRRARQINALISGLRGKPIGFNEKLSLSGIIALHCAKVAGQALTLKDRKSAARAKIWRTGSSTS